MVIFVSDLNCSDLNSSSHMQKIMHDTPKIWKHAKTNQWCQPCAIFETTFRFHVRCACAIFWLHLLFGCEMPVRAEARAAGAEQEQFWIREMVQSVLSFDSSARRDAANLLNCRTDDRSMAPEAVTTHWNASLKLNHCHCPIFVSGKCAV